MIISSIFNVLVLYKGNPFPKHPRFLENPRIWGPDTGDYSVCACLVDGLEAWVLYTCAQIDAICQNRSPSHPDMGGHIPFQFVLSLLNYSEKGVFVFLHLKYVTTEVTYIASYAC